MVVLLTKKNQFKNALEKRQQTRSETVPLSLEFVFKFDGIRIWAFSICWISLFGNNSIDVVSNDMKTDEEFISIFWPIFKWIFNAEVTNEIVFIISSEIWFAACFW